ncbi:MAG: ATP-binding protein [Microthrixaceae bacterium]
MTGAGDDGTGPATWAEVSRRLRNAHGFGQEDWAAWLEVSRKTVQRWERGDAAPSDRVEERLLAFCADKEVFARVQRGAIEVGVANVDDLRDIVAAARSAALGSTPESPVRDDAPIGRDVELALLREMLAAERMVTLVGPGGVGKTTLAGAAVDGVFVRLDTIRDPDLVLGVIASALGVRALRGGSVRDQLVRNLRDRRMLLVLDNFEHLLAAAPVVADLLASCGGLQVLVTSRAPLGLAGEVLLPLAPLDSAGADAPAARLFMERARRADPRGTELDPDLVVAVCARLDGLPLAIELAAARLRHITLEDLSARMDRALSVLGHAAPTAGERHRTLGDAIAWSFDLLEEPQRLLLRRLSPFVDGASLEAVEAVGAPDCTIDDLGALVDHSLLGRNGPRYRMLETVREYVTGLAVAVDPLADAEPFTRWAIAFARHQAGRSRGPEQRAALEETAAEYPNLRAALSGLTAAHDPRAAKLAVALCPYWDARSMLHEARRFLEPVASASVATAPLDAATARVWIGYFAAHQGDLAVADRMAREALAVFDEHSIDLGLGYARLVLGYVAAEEERFEEAAESWEASLTLLRSAGDRWGMIRPLNNLGELARARGDLTAASTWHREALEICDEVGERASLPAVLTAMAQAALDCDDLAGATAAAEEALAVAVDLENAVGRATALEVLGRATFEAGRTEDAVGLWAQASILRDQLGLPIEVRDRRLHDRLVSAARAGLGDAAFQQAWDAASVSAAPGPSNR